MFGKLYAFVAGFGDNNWKLAQMGHFLAGVVVADWFGGYGCAAFGTLWIPVKEGYVDTHKPEKDPFWYGGATDAAFYTAGMMVGMIRRAVLGI